MQNNNKNLRLPELDALRGIAAMMVVLFHYGLHRVSDESWLKFGVSGVELFFMISGFVIFMTLQKTASLQKFAINRFIRLYPTYWASLLFVSIMILSYAGLKGDIDLEDDFLQVFLANTTMLQHYFDLRDLEEPYWSLVVELSFYLFIALLFYSPFKKYLNHVILIVIFLSLFPVFVNSLRPFFKAAMFYFPALPNLSLFFVGIQFFLIHENKEHTARGLSLILFAMISQIVLFDYSGRSYVFLNQREFTAMIVLYHLIFLAFVLGRLSFIVHPITLFLGRISYALYLSHFFVSHRHIIPYLVNTLNLPLWSAMIFFALPINLLIATLLTYFVEIPSARILKRLFHKG